VIVVAALVICLRWYGYRSIWLAVHCTVILGALVGTLMVLYLLAAAAWIQ
jgi:hypothetical protein